MDSTSRMLAMLFRKSFICTGGIALRRGVINHFAKGHIAEMQEHGRPGKSTAESSEAGEAGRGFHFVREIESDGGWDRRSATVAKMFNDVVGHFGVRDFHFIRQFLEHETIRLV